jgi:hypothetical protein
MTLAPTIPFALEINFYACLSGFKNATVLNTLGLTYGLGYVNYIGEDIKNLY